MQFADEHTSVYSCTMYSDCTSGRSEIIDTPRLTRRTGADDINYSKLVQETDRFVLAKIAVRKIKRK